MNQLDGKIAIVTGAARGLGAATAKALCEQGASVVLTDVLTDVGEKTAKELTEAGFNVHFMAHDVSDANVWDAVIKETQSRFGKLDCLVNNAGINLPVTIEDATTEQFQNLLNVNLMGAFIGMKAAIPAMKANGGGSIINISSNSTRKVLSLTSIYGASKAALANLTKTTAVHLAQTQTGIRVNSVHPGAHETAMLLGDETPSTDIPAVQQLLASIPMGRMGKPSEVGAVVGFLASNAASYVNGMEFFVDGAASVC